MNWMYLLIYGLGALIAVMIGWIVNYYLPSYMGEKGKNLATKEDIQKITELTEETQRKFKENFEQFTADLKFKNDFIYKQYSGLYCKLYAIVIQSEYVRKYICLTTGKEVSFDDAPFLEISKIKRKTIMTPTCEGELMTISRKNTYIDTPISEFNKATLCDCIIANGDLVSQNLLKIAVSYRFALEHMKLTPECDDKKHAVEETENEEVRLLRELVICIVTEYNEMRKYLKLEYEEKELQSGQVSM